MAEMSEFEKKVIDARNDFENRIREGRLEHLRTWYENNAYNLGHQNIEWNRSTRAFGRMNLRKGTPTPVTNMYNPTLGFIDAELCRVEPQLSAAPGSPKDIDRLTADLAKMVINFVEAEVGLPKLRPQISKGVSINNNMYTFYGWDADAGRREFVPYWVCPADPKHVFQPAEAQKLQGMCPAHNIPLEQSADQGEELAEGAPFAELLTPFECWMDPTIKDHNDQPMALIRRMRSIEGWIRPKYPNVQFAKDRGEGYAPPKDQGMVYLQNIIRLAAGAGMGSSSGYGGMRFEGSDLVDDFLVLPNQTFKKGVYARIAGNDTILECKDFPYHDGTPVKKGKYFLPLTHWKYDDVPGAHFATGPADHLKGLQRERNRLLAAISLYFARMANGIWALPEGTDHTAITGEQGGIITYNKEAGEPKRVEGGRLPSSYSQRFAEIDQEMMRIAGIPEILQGDVPGRVDSSSAIGRLENRAQGRFAPLYLNFEQSYEDMTRKLFFIFRLNAPETTYTRIKGESSRWQFEALRAADLMGNCDIRVEVGSAEPKSDLARQAAYERALNMGLVDITDPRVRLTIIRALRVHELMDDMNQDDETIAKEHAMVVKYADTYFAKNKDSGEWELTVPIQQLPSFPVPIDPVIDNHPLHYARHRVWMQTDEFKNLPPPVQKMFRTMHLMQHMAVIDMASTGGAGTAPGQEAGGGGAETAAETASQNGNPPGPKQEQPTA